MSDALITLKNGTTIEVHEELGLIWVHPDGQSSEKSFRVNIAFRMVDVAYE